MSREGQGGHGGEESDEAGHCDCVGLCWLVRVQRRGGRVGFLYSKISEEEVEKLRKGCLMEFRGCMVSG